MNHLKLFKSYFTFEKPFALTFDGWDDWNKTTKLEQPIKWFFVETIPEWCNEHFIWSIERLLKSAYWGVIHRVVPKHRYHVIKPRTLKPGYHNPYSLLLHSSFEILVDFVEHERREGYVDWSATIEHREFWEEANKLVYWWQNIYPMRDEWMERDHPLPNSPNGCTDDMWCLKEKYHNTEEYKEFGRVCEIHRKLSEQYEDEESLNLSRLAKIKMFMWH